MSSSSRLLQWTGNVHSDWVPSKRPIHLPLPVLDYDSHYKVWEWKFRILLKHNSLQGFIEAPEPSKPLKHGSRSEQLEQAAATTHCLALLGSSVSEHILADLITLSPNNRLPDDPYVLFNRVEKLVHNIQLASEANNQQLCSYLIVAEQFSTIQEVFETLDGLNKQDYTSSAWGNLILIAALLVKRRFPSCQPAAVKHYISKVQDETLALTEKEWKNMVSEFKNAF